MNARDDDNRTPLHWAVRQGTPEVVALLLAAGAEVDARDEDGATPLLGPGRWEYSGDRAVPEPAAVDLLLDAGADANARDRSGRTVLHTAVSEPDAPNALPSAGRLLESGADPNARDDQGRTPLHLAVAGDNEALVNTLLQAGADVHARAGGGASALHAAAGASADPAVLAALLEAGVDVGARDSRGATALHKAARSGKSTAVVEFLLEAGAEVAELDSAGETALHHAASADNTATVAALLAAGADVHARNRNGETALHKGASWPSVHAGSIATILVHGGADINALDDAGRTPLQLAFRHNNWWARYELQELGAEPEAQDIPERNAGPGICELLDRDFVNAATAESLKECIESGADVNSRDRTGQTPLHRVAGGWGDPVELVSLLVGAGAIVDARDEHGRTPLHDALDAENPAVFERLIQLGADPTLPDDSGNVPDPTSCRRWNTRIFFGIAQADVVAHCIRRGADVTDAFEERTRTGRAGTTPLHLASMWTRDPAVISVMAGAGADVNARDDRNYAPLHLTARHNANPAIVSALLEAGAEVNAWATGYHVDEGWDYTPLHEATANRNPAVAAVLVEGGAHVNARGWEGWTPLHLAAARACGPVVINMLAGAGADPNLRANKGQTPLHEAARTNDNPEVIAALLKAGADVNVRAGGGRTPLHTAAKEANPAVVAVLLEAGADVNARTRDGNTPLHEAASWASNPAVLELIVKAGADLQARGRWGRTPLHAAGRPAKFSVLLSLGADPTALDDDGRTPSDRVPPEMWDIEGSSSADTRLVQNCRGLTLSRSPGRE